MKRILIALIFVLSFVTSFGQEAIQKSRFTDNWYISSGLGVSTPTSFNPTFPLNMHFYGKIGKYLNPVVGFNIEDNVWFGSATNEQGRFSYRNVVRANNLGLNVTVDMFNWFGGYNPDRVFTIIPEVGLGWLHTFNSNADDNDDLTAKTGVQFAFNVGYNRAWQLYVEPTVWWNLTGVRGVTFHKNYSQLGLQVGFIYKFKNSNGTHNFVTWNVGAINEEINNLRAELAKKPKEVIIHDTIVNKVVIRDGYVAFAQNSSTINDYEYLNSIPTNSVVNVYGYASPEGDSDYNKILSEKRAQEVANYLISKGVKVDKIEGYGANTDYSNRVVIVVNK